MASSPDFVQYIADQCSRAGDITVKKIMGDYCIYCDGILFGLNYEQRGKASERPVYVEILNRAGALINAQKLGVRVNGAYNRRNSQKSLKFFARKKYSPESGTVYLNCFDLLSEDGTQIVRYDKFVLRAGGNDFRFAFCRDELNQLLA